MQQNMLFSIVIPTYNRAYLIEKTLNSVFLQTYPHYEVIIIDDCSTDNTREVLDPYIVNNKIRYYKNETNSERSFSRNKGMDAAKGEYLTFLDSDDLMLPNNLQNAYESIQKNKGYKFFHSLYHLVDSNNKLVYKYPVPCLKNRLKAITEGNFLSCIGVFLHKEIYSKYRFDTKLNTSEDWEYWMRILADYELCRISKVNNYMVAHVNRSVNVLLVEEIIKSKNYISKKLFSDPHLRTVYHKYRNRLEANSFWYIAYIASTSNQPTLTFKYLIKALRTDIKIFFTYKYIRVLQVAIFQILGKRY